MSWYKGTPTGPSTKTLSHATPQFSLSFFLLPTHLPYPCTVLSLITPTSFIYLLSRSFFLSLWQQAKIRSPAKFPCPTFPCSLPLLPATALLPFLQSVWRTGLISMLHIHLHTFAHRSLWMKGSGFIPPPISYLPKVGGRIRGDGGVMMVPVVEGMLERERRGGGGGSSFQGTPPELMFHTCAQCRGLYQASQVRHINCGRDHFSCHRGVPLGSHEV